MEEEPAFGTHKLKCVKFRHLGEDFAGAIHPVRLPEELGGGLQQNYIHLDINNFAFTEKGDLRDMVRYLNEEPQIRQDGEEEN